MQYKRFQFRILRSQNIIMPAQPDPPLTLLLTPLYLHLLFTLRATRNQRRRTRRFPFGIVLRIYRNSCLYITTHIKLRLRSSETNLIGRGLIIFQCFFKQHTCDFPSPTLPFVIRERRVFFFFGCGHHCADGFFEHTKL